MTTPGHVFVTCGDLRYLACDAWLFPTDASMLVGDRWFLAPDAPFEPPLRPHGWSDQGVRAVAIPGPSSDPRWRVWTNVDGHDQTPVEWFVEGAAQFVRVAAQALAGTPPRFGRARHLVALPVVGSGFGNGADRTGTIVRQLLPTLETLAVEHAVDICLVTWKGRAHAAAQSIRRERWPRGFEDEGLGTTLRDAERLAELASRGELVLFLGAGLGGGAGLPTWNELLARLAAFAGFGGQELQALEGLDPLDRARLGRFGEAELIFDRMLWLNPSDNQGVRGLIGHVKARAAWVDRDA